MIAIQTMKDGPSYPERFASVQAPDVLAKRQVAQFPKEVGINLPCPNSSDEPTPAASAAQPAATPASRVSAAQRPLDAGGAVGQAAPEVLAVEVTNAPHFAWLRVQKGLTHSAARAPG